MGEIEIGDPEDTSVVISAKTNSTKYTGQVKVSYTVKKELNGVVNITNLGDDLQNDDLPTIVKAINDKNKKANLTIDDVELGQKGKEEDGKDSVIVKAKLTSQKYRGEVKVKYNIKKN